MPYLAAASTLLGPIHERQIDQRGESIQSVRRHFLRLEKIPARRGLRLCKESFLMSDKGNRFETFFETGAYTDLKNSLYNYRLRKRSVTAKIQNAPGPVLEVGSGISPMITGRDAVVYSDLSFGKSPRTLGKDDHDGRDRSHYPVT